MTEGEETIDQDRILDHEGWPGRWEILETADETDGERFKTRMELEEPGELPAHIHPKATESYEVQSGELEVMVEGDWSTLHAGESETVPPGTVHAFRNSGPVEMINVHSPALRYEEFFRQFHALKIEYGFSQEPESVRETILMAMWGAEFLEESRPESPPPFVFKLLAKVGRLVGYRLPEY
jgi:quercetin dioxygenase-like cupin family protein